MTNTTTHTIDVVSYCRVSSQGQGESGLGLEAQREYIARAAQQNGWNIVAEFVDVVSGKLAIEDRPEGKKALSACKKVKAQLVVAKLDRLSRSVHHIARLMEQIEFKVATMSHAKTFELHLFAALAEQERTFIATRTKEALAALQARADGGDVQSVEKIARRTAALEKGRTAPNRAKAGEAIRERVYRWQESVRDPIDLCIHKGGRTLKQVADCLNSKGVTTSRGGEWSSIQVSRVMKSLGLQFPLKQIDL
ncbi:site-specific recombinase, resolvase family [Pseudomonas sp. R2-37-08W]|uniref:recombinase family protein n=1 Tax=Pseudomonas sp. R2-37-08W TaxID=1173273 RepID=UPI000F70E7E3|nr:recombinase family protein [Pseudomonas sp. R2-37-08W]AZF11671.1 site-specific recombinase, resolvase family [Pseudomonas sp. R2-37-08W]